MDAAYIVKVSADGRVEREPFDAADSLSQLQRAVGGYIERVSVELGRGIDLFVDEEGKLNGLDENGVLTRFRYHRARVWDSLVGNGAFAKHDGEGETVGLTEDECADIERTLARFGGTVVKAEGGAR